MRRSLRSVLVPLAAVPLALGGLVGLAPAQAGAADEIIYAFTLAPPYQNNHSLHVLDTATHADTELPGTYNAADHFFDVSVSPDATKVAWVDDGPSGFNSTLKVYDRGTHAITELFTAVDAGAGYPVWTPDSASLLLWTPTPDGTNEHLTFVRLNGTATTVPNTAGAGDADVSPSGQQIVFSRNVASVPTLFMINKDGTGLASLGVSGRSPRWSHDGSRILALVDLMGPDRASLGSVVITVTPRGTGRRVLTSTYHPTRIEAAQWSPDGARIMTQGGYGVDVTPATGSGGVTSLAPGAEWFPAGSFAGPWTRTDVTAPTLAFGPTVTLGATSASFGWGPNTAPAGDLVGLRFAVSAGMTVPASYAAGAKRITTFGRSYSAAVTGLVAGGTYSYAMWAFDGSGNVSAPATGHFRLIAPPLISAPAIASTSSTGGSILVTYRTVGAGAAGTRLAFGWVRPDGSGGSGLGGALVLSRSGTVAFGRAGIPMALSPGASYALRGGAADAWGNVRWASTSVVSQVPYDDRDAPLHYSGAWTRSAATRSWQGTTSSTRTGGAVTLTDVKRGVAARKFSVIATTSPGGGRFKVYLDGHYVRTISTASSTTRVRRTVWTSATLASRTHTLRLVQVAGSGWFRLDAVSLSLGR
jgi:hypothetical protein